MINMQHICGAYLCCIYRHPSQWRRSPVKSGG